MSVSSSSASISSSHMLSQVPVQDQAYVPVLDILQKRIEMISRCKEKTYEGQGLRKSSASASTVMALQDATRQKCLEDIGNFVRYMYGHEIHSEAETRVWRELSDCVQQLPLSIAINAQISKVFAEHPNCSKEKLMRAREQKILVCKTLAKLEFSSFCLSEEACTIEFREANSEKWATFVESLYSTICSDTEADIFKQDAVSLLLNVVQHRRFWWNIGQAQTLAAPNPIQDVTKDLICANTLYKALQAVVDAKFSSQANKKIAQELILTIEKEVQEGSLALAVKLSKK